jgi:hypothetical protein
MRQQRSLLLLIRFGHWHSATSAGRGDERSGHVGAEKRDGDGVTAVAHGQHAPSAGCGLRICERCVRAEADVGRSMPLCGIEAVTVLVLALPPSTIAGSVILMWPPTVLLLKFADE